MNTPKITYRSDTTGRTYNMYVHGIGHFRILVINKMNETVDEKVYKNIDTYKFRKTVNKFMDAVEKHINTGEWIP